MTWLTLLQRVPGRVWGYGALLAATVSLGGWLYHQGVVHQREQERRAAMVLAQKNAKAAVAASKDTLASLHKASQQSRDTLTKALVRRQDAKSKVKVLSPTVLEVTTDSGVQTVAVPKEVTDVFAADSAAIRAAMIHTMNQSMEIVGSTTVINAQDAVITVQDTLLATTEPPSRLATAAKATGVVVGVALAVKYVPKLLRFLRP